MKVFGLIGKKLSHSFSKEYFSNKFITERIKDVKYQNFEIEDINEIKNLIIKYNISGLNVTIPYKSDVIPLLDTISQEAKEIGAVNTIQIKDNLLIGHNTDIIGFKKSIEPILKKRKVLILGNGGGSKSVQHVLKKLNVEFDIVNRNSRFNYSKINKKILKYYTLIINTTPLGMYPKIDEYPNIPYEELNSSHFLYDLIYNPQQTRFLQNGLKKKCKIKNGLEMPLDKP